jgi:hypothetical protein
MKKVVAVVSLLFGIVAAGPLYQALNLKDNFTYLKLRGIVADNRETPKLSELIEAHFIPLGWGGNRRFAFLLIPANEARDCEWAELHIQDLSTDKTLFEKEYELCAPPHTIPEESQTEESLTVLIQRLERHYGNKIEQMLVHFGIERSTPLKLREFPIAVGPNSINYILETRRKTELGFSPDDLFVARWRLQLILDFSGKHSRKKTIHTERYRDLHGLYDLRPLGYFLSPDTRRAAILIGMILRGWEGIPAVMELQIVGALLTRGWK